MNQVMKELFAGIETSVRKPVKKEPALIERITNSDAVHWYRLGKAYLKKGYFVRLFAPDNSGEIIDRFFYHKSHAVALKNEAINVNIFAVVAPIKV